MNELAFPDQTNFTSHRLSAFMYLKGIVLDFMVSNRGAFPVFWHVAIVQDRDDNNSDLDRRQNFFRDTTSLTARAHPFNDWTAGATYDARQTVNGINSDHYKIITHMKMLLQGRTQTTTHASDGPYQLTKKKYFPIKRRIAFDNLVDTTNWRPFYICFWWQAVDPADHNTATSPQLGYRYKTDVVFKNVI